VTHLFAIVDERARLGDQAGDGEVRLRGVAEVRRGGLEGLVLAGRGVMYLSGAGGGPVTTRCAHRLSARMASAGVL
jgi:hypothetical protein